MKLFGLEFGKKTKKEDIDDERWKKLKLTVDQFSMRLQKIALRYGKTSHVQRKI
jgi:hypothetical protein